MNCMEGSPGNGLATHFGKQMRRDRLAKRWSIAELARRINATPAHLGRVESGARPPTVRLAALLDEVFPERGGYYVSFMDDYRTAPEIPATFRSWSDYEEGAATLRVWEPGIVSGLAQSEGYARALIAAEPGMTADTEDIRVKTRLDRQRRVVNRPEPPRLTLLVDQVALWRRVRSARVMAEQMAHLAEIAELPHVTVQVVPAIEHAANTSGYVLSDDAVWCEHLASGGVFTDPQIVSGIAARHDSLRAECYRASESLAMILEEGERWRTGGSRAVQAATAETA